MKKIRKRSTKLFTFGLSSIVMMGTIGGAIVACSVNTNGGGGASDDVKNKIFRGDPATPEQMFQFVRTAEVNKIMKTPEKVGVKMPTKIWSKLDKPKINKLTSHISAPFVDIGGWNELQKFLVIKKMDWNMQI